jgi:septal ring factor EnvC (AmiA/AmiB activator)
MRASRSRLLLALAAIALGSTAQAADNTKAQKAEVRRLHDEQRKLTQQKTELETKLKEADAKIEDSDHALARANGRSAVLDKKLKTSEDDKAQLKAKLEETERRLAEQTDARQRAETEDKRLTAALSAQEKATASCEEKNVQLYRYGQEMALRYQNKSVSDALMQSEPVTGLKRVEIENLLEEYRDWVDSQKIEPAAGRPAAGQYP